MTISEKRTLFNRPLAIGAELENIKRAIENEKLGGDGEYTRLCEARLLELTGSQRVLLAQSCTAALEMAAILLNLTQGDEVIMPSYTFPSTANAVVLRGATPVFVDIRADTLNLDERILADAITERTRAIFVVHYGGVPCEMHEINRISNAYGIPIVEDAAQALTSTYEGKPAGSLGDLACFSFHESKNIISGEGGCLAINDPQYTDRAEIIREKGTNRKQFFRGTIDKYTWVDIGSSYLPSELVSAFLYAQIEMIDAIQAKRMFYWQRYFDELSPLLNRGYRLPHIPPNVEHNAHLFYVIAPSSHQRDIDIRNMRQLGVDTVFHFVPLHSAPAGKRFGRCGTRLNVTDDLSSRILRLPLHIGLESDQDRVITSALQTFGSLESNSH